jgi:hypothetical protein
MRSEDPATHPFGRWLTVTTNEQFEEFVRAMARKADAKELPPFRSL